uniref:Peptidase S1 domain-containing protein n=1 Tax=Corethron hystrix TaxID=216773 RepID=A0A7S1BEN0_9STRA|mmetsp:Transcript_22594/g.51769  ORF Transcript_22594/g.51769 Transcript_22594/m.51769 type:complete len:343 (+) Transcript_22594:274-1302(+)
MRAFSIFAVLSTFLQFVLSASPLSDEAGESAPFSENLRHDHAARPSTNSPWDRLVRRQPIAESNLRRAQEKIAKIHGGTPVSEKYNGVRRYPYYVLSVNTRNIFCGGVLIADNAIMTAAHCHEDVAGVVVFEEVLIGIQNLFGVNEYERFGVKKMLQHHQYVKGETDNDYMIIILDGKTSLTPICMACRDQKLERDQSLNIIGFGITEQGILSTQLLETDVKYITNHQCRALYEQWEPGEDDDFYQDWDGPEITNNMLCADSSEEGKDACQGDSGGPLILTGEDPTGKEDVLVGLISWGIGCGTYPGVYARINNRVVWAQRVVKRFGGTLPECKKCGCPNAN